MMATSSTPFSEGLDWTPHRCGTLSNRTSHSVLDSWHQAACPLHLELRPFCHLGRDLQHPFPVSLDHGVLKVRLAILHPIVEVCRNEARHGRNHAVVVALPSGVPLPCGDADCFVAFLLQLGQFCLQYLHLRLPIARYARGWVRIGIGLLCLLDLQPLKTILCFFEYNCLGGTFRIQLLDAFF